MTNQEIVDSIRKLAKNQKVTNPNILNLLKTHKCEHLLLNSSIPTQDEISNIDRITSRIETIERYKACQMIFSQKQIPYAIVKGAVLSKSLFSDPFLRKSKDIDILIRRDDADIVKSLLNSIGFYQGKIVDDVFCPFSRKEIIFYSSMTHQIAPFVKKTGNDLCPYVYLDVNTTIMWGESNHTIDMNYVLTHVQDFELFGFRFFKLSPEMEFVHLCLHHYKDMNSIYLLDSGSLRLGLYYEIYIYLIRIKLNMQKLKEICDELTIGTYVYTCIYQTQQIFDDETLDYYLTALKHYENDALLNSFGLNDEERIVWTIDIAERLFKTNLSKYIRSMISDKELKKISINRQLL